MSQDNKMNYEIETVINGEIKKPNFLYETLLEATTEFNKFCELCCFNMFPKETRFMIHSVPNVNGTVTLFNNSFEEKQILLSFSCEVKNNEKPIIIQETDPTNEPGQ